jgi:hypothetical protein
MALLFGLGEQPVGDPRDLGPIARARAREEVIGATGLEFDRERLQQPARAQFLLREREGSKGDTLPLDRGLQDDIGVGDDRG